MQLIVNLEAATLSTYIGNPLVRAVLISLFSWRRANADDDVQDGDRQGWWADTYNTDGDLTGSRIWELLRQKVTAQALRQAEEFGREALQWLIDDGVASTVDVAVEAGESGRVDMLVTVTKPDRSATTIRFQDVWEKLQ